MKKIIFAIWAAIVSLFSRRDPPGPKLPPGFKLPPGAKLHPRVCAQSVSINASHGFAICDNGHYVPLVETQASSHRKLGA